MFSTVVALCGIHNALIPRESGLHLGLSGYDIRTVFSFSGKNADLLLSSACPVDEAWVRPPAQGGLKTQGSISFPVWPEEGITSSAHISLIVSCS